MLGIKARPSKFEWAKDHPKTELNRIDMACNTDPPSLPLQYSPKESTLSIIVHIEPALSIHVAYEGFTFMM